MNLPILICALIGLAISVYMYFIEQNLKQTPDYKPVCDINDRISCTKSMKSVYNNIFLISNPIACMLYYVVIAILALLHFPMVLLGAAIGGVVITGIFAYFLFFKIVSLCVLCVSMYIINGIILYLSIMNL